MRCKYLYFNDVLWLNRVTPGNSRAPAEAPYVLPAWLRPRCWSRCRTQPSSARRTGATACRCPDGSMDQTETDNFYFLIHQTGKMFHRQPSLSVSWSLHCTRFHSARLGNYRLPPKQSDQSERPTQHAPPLPVKLTNGVQLSNSRNIPFIPSAFCLFDIYNIYNIFCWICEVEIN